MSSTGQMLMIVCYDVADDKRRDKVYHLMCGAGDRIQYSVFRCVLSDLQLARLKEDLAGVIDRFDDQVLFVPLGAADNPRSWSMSWLGKTLHQPARSVKIVSCSRSRQGL